MNRSKIKPAVAIIGGGIFGLTSALVIGKFFPVTVFERRKDILGEASWANQYRHHSGYHYPRSQETIDEILQAAGDFEKFYKPVIIKKLPSFYSIIKEGSKTTVRDFVKVCDHIGLPYKPDFPDQKFLNRSAVAACFKITEGIYDYEKLKSFIKEKIKKNKNIKLRLAHRVTGAKLGADGFKILSIAGPKKTREKFDFVINATYANYNDFCGWMGFPKRKIHYRLKEIVLLKIPGRKKEGVMIMDGPFATFLPTGHGSLYTFGDAPLSIHEEYALEDSAIKIEKRLKKLKTRWPQMKKRCMGWMPILAKAEYAGSMFVILPVEPASDSSDARPTNITNHGHGCFSVLSGKIITSVSATKTILMNIKNASKDGE